MAEMSIPLAFYAIAAVPVLALPAMAVFAKKKPERVEALRIILPYSLSTGLSGAWVLLVALVFISMCFGVFAMMYERLGSLDPFLSGCIVFFMVMGIVVSMAILPPTRITLGTDAVEVAKLSRLTGMPRRRRTHRIAVAGLDRVTLQTGGQGRSRGAGISLGDATNPSRISFLVPAKFGSARALAAGIGAAYGWPVYLRSGISILKMDAAQ